MAIAHRILKAIYHVIKHAEKFKDLEDYLSDLNKKSKINYLIRQAGKFGYMLTPCAVLEKQFSCAEKRKQLREQWRVFKKVDTKLKLKARQGT